jgi:hypothetical protein
LPIDAVISSKNIIFKHSIVIPSITSHATGICIISLIENLRIFVSSTFRSVTIIFDGLHAMSKSCGDEGGVILPTTVLLLQFKKEIFVNPEYIYMDVLNLILNLDDMYG